MTPPPGTHTRRGRESDDEEATHEEKQEAEYLTETVLLARVAVSCCGEQGSIGNRDYDEEPGPDPKRTNETG